jgi:hypothetical protein
MVKPPRIRLSVWDEIQETLRVAELKRRYPDASPLERDLLDVMTRPVAEPDRYDVINASGGLCSTITATMQGIRECALCSHAHAVHSQILPFEPCLDCDCIGWTRFERPNPSRCTPY